MSHRFTYFERQNNSLLDRVVEDYIVVCGGYSVYEIVSIDTLHEECMCSNVYDNMDILKRI